MKKPVPVLVVVFLVLAVSSGAFAAKGLLTGSDIKSGSLTGSNIAKGSLGPTLFTGSAKNALRGAAGSRGTRGAAGLAGSNGVNGTNGSAGINGGAGTNGTPGVKGVTGTAGANGITGASGTDGTAGAKGVTGSNGTDGTDGTAGVKGITGSNGADGTVTPLSATATASTALPTASPPVVIIFLDVPAGNYIILAKTQLSQTGAGDSVDCNLEVGAAIVDTIAMKTLPALGAVPVSLQAVTTVTSTTRLSVECHVEVANGAAAFSSLIAIPTS